jgi:serine/threonine protein kinase/tetratricopeptide (TPR) repeat protein
LPGLGESSLEELFLEFTEMSSDARSLSLANLTSQHPELAAQLALLLAADDSNRDGLLGLFSPEDHAIEAVEEVPLKVGQYQVRHLVGRGGMGSVYAALHPGTGRQCAVKLLHPGFATRQNLQRFYREAEYLARLDHPGIARIYDAGTAEIVYASGDRTQRPFIAMEFITGIDILTHVRRAGASLLQCAELMASVAQALHHAHECGIIHRDIKPGNILVDGSGAVKVVDFGIARLAGGLDLTTGYTPGTAAYMSPEQMAGLRDRVDTRTDVYALGATLYALVTGLQPCVRMAAPGIDIAWRTGKPDRRLKAILDKAMAWAPEHRYSSAAQFANDLHGWMAGKPILARPERLDWLRRLRRSHPRTLYAAVAAGVIVALVATQPDWRLHLRARFLPPPVHSLVLLNFTPATDPAGDSSLPAQFNGWAAQEFLAGGLLKPMAVPPGMRGVLPQGSSTLLSQAEVAKLRRLGAQYALVGDYDLSGNQPWSTLKVEARLIDIAQQKTAEVVSAQGSLAEAQALIAEVCVQLTQSAGKREQFLRLQHNSHPESDTLYADGLALFAKRDLIEARTVLEQALNRDYANTAARLALARVLDALGYRDLASKHASLAIDFASGNQQRIDAQALALELDARPEEALRLRDTIALPAGERDGWMARTSRIKDLLALDQWDRAAAEIKAASSEPGATAAERVHWLSLRLLYIRLLNGRPGFLDSGRALVTEARRDGSPTMVADALLLASEAYTFTGAQQESIAAIKEAESLYASHGDREGRARAMLMLGQRLQIHGRNGDAIRILSDAMRDVSGAGFLAVEQQIDQLLGQAYGRGYDPELSRQMLSRALVLSWNEPEPYATRQILQRLGITMTEAGNLAEARRLLESALPAHVERGEAAARTFNALGEVDLLAGDANAALADADHAANLGAGSEDVETDAMIVRARALALKGDVSTIETSFRKAVQIAERRGMPGSVANEQLQWGECLLQRGLASSAVPHLRAAADLFLQIDRPAYRGESEALLATAFASLGDGPAAMASLARAAAIESVLRFAHPRILYELAEAHVAFARGRRDEAKRLYQAARGDASHVGFVPVVRAADQALLDMDRVKSTSTVMPRSGL